MKRLVLNYLVIVALLVSAVFTSCGSSGSGGKGLNGAYEGYSGGDKYSINFSGNKFKWMHAGEIYREGVFEIVEEYKEDDFSRGKLILTYRNGTDEVNYILEGKILTANGAIFIKGGKNVKISDGTFSNSDDYRERKVSYTFSGNNAIFTNFSGVRTEYRAEYSYEFIVGYENKGISKGYILLRNEKEGNALGCVLEKDKLTIGSWVYTKE